MYVVVAADRFRGMMISLPSSSERALQILLVVAAHFRRGDADRIPDDTRRSHTCY
jgi:hypothetical protein